MWGALGGGFGLQCGVPPGRGGCEWRERGGRSRSTRIERERRAAGPTSSHAGAATPRAAARPRTSRNLPGERRRGDQPRVGGFAVARGRRGAASDPGSDTGEPRAYRFSPRNGQGRTDRSRRHPSRGNAGDDGRQARSEAHGRSSRGDRAEWQEPALLGNSRVRGARFEKAARRARGGRLVRRAQLESQRGSALQRVDPRNVPRTSWRRARVRAARRGHVEPRKKPALRSLRLGRRQLEEGSQAQTRLRRHAVFHARLFRLEARAAIAYRHCSSGDQTSPPRCGKPRSIL
jgi:hypothetical protein